MAKQWYKTRDEIAGSQHRGQELQPKKYVRMTEAQAKIHNKGSKEDDPKLTETEPTKAEECQFASDWTEWQKEKTEPAQVETETAATEEAKPETKSRSRRSKS